MLDAGARREQRLMDLCARIFATTTTTNGTTDGMPSLASATYGVQDWTSLEFEEPGDSNVVRLHNN
jgi:hypothetical protein